MHKEFIINKNNSLLFLFYFTVALVYSSYKEIVYFVPFVLIFVSMIWAGNAIIKRLLIIILIFGSYSIINVFNQDFRIFNVLLSCITYGSIVFYYTVPSKAFYSKYVWIRINSIVLYLLVFQSLIGISQAVLMFLKYGTFDGSIGDAVTGTIGLFEKNTSSSNPVFSINIAMLTLFVWNSSLLNKQWKKTGVILGILAIVMASVVHVIVLLVCSILVIVFFVYHKKNLKMNNMKLFFVPLALIGLLYFTQQDNVNRFHTIANLIERNPKYIIIQQ